MQIAMHRGACKSHTGKLGILTKLQMFFLDFSKKTLIAIYIAHILYIPTLKKRATYPHTLYDITTKHNWAKLIIMLSTASNLICKTKTW